eukprot:1157076-Pelagomonas_calceolata.AAC.2
MNFAQCLESAKISIEANGSLSWQQGCFCFLAYLPPSSDDSVKGFLQSGPWPCIYKLEHFSQVTAGAFPDVDESL